MSDVMAHAPMRAPAGTPVERAALERYADVIVELGSNVQPGQIVEIRCELEHVELARALAASAYRRGARFVDVWYIDSDVRRARFEHADPDTLDFVPRFHRERVLQLGEQHCARIALSPMATPGRFDDLDPALVARDRFPLIPEYMRVINDNTTNWTGAMCPTPAWAELVHPDVGPEEALAVLWQQVLHICRLDEPDPVVAWGARLDALTEAETRLNERRFDALQFEGPGTDLTIGLLPSSTWHSGISYTVDGIAHLANIPTEETFTAPDPQRVDGVVRSTKPLQIKSGTLVRGLRVRFEGGRAVEIDADSGAEALRTLCASDEGASRLGEVALVDGQGRVGALDTVFYSTLLDENAASHIALGSAYSETVGDEDRDRANDSSIHVDFMIGGEDVAVTGLTSGGERVPVLVDGDWQIY
ncbi:MAG: aminopeptidase [Gaiellaceae bacterium]